MEKGCDCVPVVESHKEKRTAMEWEKKMLCDVTRLAMVLKFPLETSNSQIEKVNAQDK
jgi:hypothetical protein